MAFFQRYSSETLDRIRLRGSLEPWLDDRFWLRPEEGVGLFFFGVLAVLALVSGKALFEDLDESRLAYLSTRIFAMLVLGLLAWTLAERGRAWSRRVTGAVTAEQDAQASRLAWARVWRVTRDWLPAILCIGVYESLKHLHLNEIILWLGNRPKDDLFIRMEEIFFGGHASVWMQRFVSPPVTLVMLLVYYVGYYVYPSVVGAMLYLFRPRRAFREVMLAFIATAFIGYTFYVLVPVAGPRYEIRHLYHVTFVPKWTLQMWQEQSRFDYDCFPSLHTAIPIVVTVIAYRHMRWLGAVLTPFVAATVVSTLYLQMHYLTDVVAGVALVPFTVALGIYGDRLWGGLLQRLGVPERDPARGAAWASPGLVTATRVLRAAAVVLAVYWVGRAF